MNTQPPFVCLTPWSRTFLSGFSHVEKPLLSSYCNPKNHVSRKPIVRHTKSNSVPPVALCSNLNSNSESNVMTFTGNDLSDFFRLNGDILNIYCFACVRACARERSITTVRSTVRDAKRKRNWFSEFYAGFTLCGLRFMICCVAFSRLISNANKLNRIKLKSVDIKTKLKPIKRKLSYQTRNIIIYNEHNFPTPTLNATISRCIFSFFSSLSLSFMLCVLCNSYSAIVVGRFILLIFILLIFAFNFW